MFFASSLFALLPSVAKSVSRSAAGYGLLLGCFGVGAVLGALVMQPLRARWSTETVVSTGVTILGVVIVTTGALHKLSTLGAAMLVGGGAWILFISLVSALIQNLAPDWVRARVLAVFILVSQGSVAITKARPGLPWLKGLASVRRCYMQALEQSGQRSSPYSPSSRTQPPI